ncbi:MAG: nucleoside kinase, partial [Paramuribaculum sp.]|nr:nucleoside kinase [Paramuribaculum sp.]
MSATLKIYCVNTGSYIDAEGGDSLDRIYQRSLAGQLGFRPVCAYVNNKTEGMQYRVYAPKMVEFLDPSSQPADRVYVRSLCMMLYKAVADTFSGARLRIEHSVSHGYYCTLSGAGEVTPAMVGAIERKMRELVARDIPFRRLERLTTDVAAMFRSQGLDDKARLLDTLHELYTTYYELDGTADSYYCPMVPSTGVLGVFGLIPYKEVMLLTGRDPGNLSEPRRPVEQEKMFRAFTDHVRFNSIIGVRNAGELNEMVERGQEAMVINIAEALHNKMIASIADEIAERHRNGGARIVLVAGPSSSGKTTFTKRLAIQLMANLLKPKMISLDDYFVDREATPLDEYGEYDYESLYALDLATFNDHLNRLLAGEAVQLPRYNFERGLSELSGELMSIDSDSVLLLEGIHGLNPELTAQVDPRMKYTVYVSALTTISVDDHNWVPTTDNRLLRRIIRDYKYRGVSAVDTIRRWPSVRRGEERWIFPYQENADTTFNSSLLFELGVLKERGEEILRRVPRDIPEYAEAYRLRKFLSYFASVSEKYIPSTSLLREFLGGISFHY